MGVFITNSYNMGSCLSKALADQSINKVSLRDISKETNSDLDQSQMLSPSMGGTADSLINC